jgi:hypothetical protein
VNLRQLSQGRASQARTTVLKQAQPEAVSLLPLVLGKLLTSRSTLPKATVVFPGASKSSCQKAMRRQSEKTSGMRKKARRQSWISQSWRTRAGRTYQTW